VGGQTLIFNTLRTLVFTHTHAKDQGQRSVCSKVKSGNGWAEAIALPPMLTQLLKVKCTTVFLNIV